MLANSLRRAAASAASWLLAPRIVWSFLDWPQLRRRARAPDALTDAAFAEYEQTLLCALQETRAGLSSYAAAVEQLRAWNQRSADATDALKIVEAQYREGLVDTLARTLAERDAISANLAATRALTSQRQAIVDVYRGSGWRMAVGIGGPRLHHRAAAPRSLGLEYADAMRSYSLVSA